MAPFPLVLFLLLAAGIQYALGGAALTAPLRDPLPQIVRTAVECTACCGFWVGVGLHGAGLDIWGPHVALTSGQVALRLLGSGLVASVGVPFVRFFGPDGGGAKAPPTGGR